MGYCGGLKVSYLRDFLFTVANSLFRVLCTLSSEAGDILGKVRFSFSRDVLTILGDVLFFVLISYITCFAGVGEH